jgi:hypothetical protein
MLPVSEPAPSCESQASQEWTCGNCGVEVRLIDSQERRGLPANWAENDQGPVCLHCRRQLAGEAAVSAVNVPLLERARLRSSTIVEFEVMRTPARTNTQIANAVHSSVRAVQNARKRLDASGPSV